MSADVLGDVQPINPALTIKNTAVPTKMELFHSEQWYHRYKYFDRGKLCWGWAFLSASGQRKPLNSAAGAGERAQQLRVFAILPEDLGLVPSTTSGSYNCGSKDLMPS